MVSALFQQLFGDAGMAALTGDEAAIAAMLRAEAALARAQAGLGIIPADAGDAIIRAAAGLRPDPAALAPGVARAGIAAQPLIAALKQAAGPYANWVHFGATSQDITDTGLMIQLQGALDLLRDRLVQLDELLAARAAKEAGRVIPAHTRFQIAAPTTLGAKIAVWRAPLSRQIARLDQMRPRLLNLSLFGAAGTSAALGPHAAALRRAMARDLGLGVVDVPWHATRDIMAELGGWLSMTTGATGKIGADLVMMSQSETGLVSAGQGGGSSTMPQKSNPVAAEALITLGRLNAGDLGTLHQAQIHAGERDGSALALEWSLLPAMLERAAASLRIAAELAGTLRADPARISAAFAADRGAMMAEAAGFVLAREMPRDEAQAIIADALRAMAAEPGLTLAGALERAVPGRDWTDALAPGRHTGEAALIARAGAATATSGDAP
ncbi:MAG: lyase family protein [Paracoccus sp. (in: a-proteobacteria)]|nr:lyase family protein [Paracoccus sp. (in: a-proteobacteria)]